MLQSHLGMLGGLGRIALLQKKAIRIIYRMKPRIHMSYYELCLVRFVYIKVYIISKFRLCIENECCCPRTVNIQILTLFKKYLYCQSQCSKHGTAKCLALITQMVRAIGMNPKVGGSSPPQVETFRSQNPYISQEHPFMCRKWMMLPAHSSYSKC